MLDLLTLPPSFSLPLHGLSIHHRPPRFPTPHVHPMPPAFFVPYSNSFVSFFSAKHFKLPNLFLYSFSLLARWCSHRACPRSRLFFPGQSRVWTPRNHHEALWNRPDETLERAFVRTRRECGRRKKECKKTQKNSPRLSSTPLHQFLCTLVLFSFPLEETKHRYPYSFGLYSSHSL